MKLGQRVVARMEEREREALAAMSNAAEWRWDRTGQGCGRTGTGGLRRRRKLLFVLVDGAPPLASPLPALSLFCERRFGA